MSLSHIFSCALWTYVIIFLLILCKSKEKLQILDLNYQFVKWLDSEQTYCVQNASSITLKNWIHRKKLFSLQ